MLCVGSGLVDVVSHHSCMFVSVYLLVGWLIACLLCRATCRAVFAL